MALKACQLSQQQFRVLVVKLPASCGRRYFHSAQGVFAGEKLVPGVNRCPDDCLCSHDISFDYKNVRLLSQFVSNQTGLIIPRTITKVCMTKQREVAHAVKRARTAGFLPYTQKLTEYLRDPQLF